VPDFLRARIPAGAGEGIPRASAQWRMMLILFSWRAPGWPFQQKITGRRCCAKVIDGPPLTCNHIARTKEGGLVVHVFRSARFLVALSGVTGGCAIMPDLPPDWAMPQSEIVLHSACEVQSALRVIAQNNSPKTVFDPDGWTVKITLNPKVDADIAPGAGVTRRQRQGPRQYALRTWCLAARMAQPRRRR
jgi:hypothetical protein